MSSLGICHGRHPLEDGITLSYNSCRHNLYGPALRASKKEPLGICSDARIYTYMASPRNQGLSSWITVLERFNIENVWPLSADFLKIRATKCLQGELASPSSKHFKVKML
jgi:hypothetical protein